jgi:hypothetical protein
VSVDNDAAPDTATVAVVEPSNVKAVIPVLSDSELLTVATTPVN